MGGSVLMLQAGRRCSVPVHRSTGRKRLSRKHELLEHLCNVFARGSEYSAYHSRQRRRCSYKISGMLMVVFGAGASYDSVPSKRPVDSLSITEAQFRPPLANQLFEPRPWFVEIMKRFPDCQAVIPYLEGRIGGSVEQELERLQSEAE